MEKPTIRLVDGTFTYKKGDDVKTLGFYASYQTCSDNILLSIQGTSPTIINAAKNLLLTYGPEIGLMVISLSRMEYTDFITNVLNHNIQLGVLDRTDSKYKPFPGTWSGEIKAELPSKSNSASSCAIAGGRRRTRRRKHKRRSTRRRKATP